MTVHAIVLAAGSGRRFGGKKQFLELAGKPILVHSLVSFQETDCVNDVICVVPKEDLILTEGLISEYRLSKVNKVLSGGKTRQDSAAAAIDYLENKQSPNDIVLVHDAARPFLSTDLISILIQQAKMCGGAVAGRRVTDSLKTVSKKGVLQNSVPREGIWAMQTPQVFRLSILAEAYRRGTSDHFIASDDAMMVERLGVQITCIEGPPENIKITDTLDLRWAEYYLKRQAIEEVGS